MSLAYFHCRGTASKKHWNSNLDYGKVDIDIENDFKLHDLDKRDGLSLASVDFDGSALLLSAYEKVLKDFVQI